MKFLKKNLSIVALIIVALGAAIYYMYPDDTETITADGSPSSSSEASFLGYANELDTVILNTELFSDPRFLSLKDIRTTVVSELSGRRDPFAPLSGTAAP